MTIEGPRTDEAGPQVDPTGEPVEDAGLEPEAAESTRSGEGRVLDRGAIYAAMVGLGLAVTIAMSFGLVVAIQALVFISAPIAGITIGWYANHKSMRWRPRWRLFANASFAGGVAGLSLALLYVALRLLFVFADSGYRPETMGGQIDCATGPECTYVRYAEDDAWRATFEDEGVVDAASYESFVWRTSAQWTLELTLYTLLGAVGAATWRAVRKSPEPEEIEALIAATE